MDQRLTEAAQSGNIDALYAIIHEDPFILDKIDAVPFVDTPFHVAVESGRIAFAMEMMNLKHSFARKLNTNGLSPLHLALEKDQTRLALELVKVDPSLVRVRGREGMIPLHLVVRKGDVELLTEFLLALLMSEETKIILGYKKQIKNQRRRRHKFIQKVPSLGTLSD